MEDAPQFETASQAESPNPREAIGGNKPPTTIDFARDAYRDLSKFLKDTPVIQDEDAARSAKLFLDRSKATVADLEAARDREAKPLHQAWQEARAKFAAPLESLATLVSDLKARMTVWARAEEAKRVAEALAKQKAAEEAAALARAAEQAEAEARENASLGDLEADVGAKVAEADQAFSDYKHAQHDANRATREAPVRIGGGFARAATLRTVKTLVVEDAAKALAALGATEAIKAAMLTSARAYKKLLGKLPDGVVEEFERKL